MNKRSYESKKLRVQARPLLAGGSAVSSLPAPHPVGRVHEEAGSGDARAHWMRLGGGHLASSRGPNIEGHHTCCRFFLNSQRDEAETKLTRQVQGDKIHHAVHIDP